MKIFSIPDMGSTFDPPSQRKSVLQLLKEYQDELEKEKQGINERIKEIEAS